MWFQLIAILPLCWIAGITGHGRLLDPPSRSTMWRYGFNNPHNYDDNQLYCGGVHVQYDLNGGKCGICGDPWNGSRPNEPPGKYANGIVVRKYSPGQVMTVVVELTASHKGWMEFKICPNDDPSKTVTQECLDKYVLPLAGTRSRKFQVPDKNGYQKFRLKLLLPKYVKCKACVFQWKYNAGNSWGTDPVSGRGCLGCGQQEQFYGCADIAIGYDDIAIESHKPLPADMEDDYKDDTDTPDITDWHWTVPPTHSVGPTDSDKQIQTVHQDGKTFSFMPVMNSKGMSPCMCVCKKAPLKLRGGADNNIEVKFFEGLEGLDNQVCMCMCQNSAPSLAISYLLVLCAVLFIRMFKIT